ncbi:MAG: radical SAM protein, partial [Kofleriaceae bacterium]
VRPTSARWAWVEYKIAQGERCAGLAIMDAHRAGGSFAAYKKAFEARGVVPTGPRARVPSSLELIALKRQRIAAL